jgi:hypothetical protein
MYINVIHHSKIHLRIPYTTLVWKYIFNFSNFMMGNILSQIYSIHSNFSMFVGFFKIIDYIKSKANQVYFKQAKIIQDLMSICYKKNNCRKIILVTTIFGGLSVLSPSCRNSQIDDAIGTWLCHSIVHIQWTLPCIWYSKSSSNWNCEQGPML